MKKTYIQPNITLVKTDLGESILNTVSGFDDSLSGNGVNSGAITSKKNKGIDLWDESWETPEENEE